MTNLTKFYRDLAERVTRFGAAFEAESGARVAAALARRPVLTDQETLTGSEARALIQLCPSWALREISRRDFWQMVDQQSAGWESAFEYLREAIERDLRDPQVATYYAVPKTCESKPQLMSAISDQAAGIAKAFSAPSLDQTRHAIEGLLSSRGPAANPAGPSALVIEMLGPPPGQPGVRLKIRAVRRAPGGLSHPVRGVAWRSDSPRVIAIENNVPVVRGSGRARLFAQVGREETAVEVEVPALENQSRLKIRMPTTDLFIEDRIPVEIFREDGRGTWNVTRRARLTVEPSFRAEIREGRLCAVAAGPIKLTAADGEERIELLLHIAGDPVHDPDSYQGAELTDTELARRSVADTADGEDTLPVNQDGSDPDAETAPIPLIYDDMPMQSAGPLEDEIPTIAITDGRAADDPKTLMMASPPGLLASSNPMAPVVGKPELAATAAGAAAPKSPADTLADEPGLPSAASERAARADFEETVRFGGIPLVLGLFVIPPSVGLPQVLIDGALATSIGAVFLQHVLLFPGLRSVEIELRDHQRRLALDRLEIDWRHSRSTDMAFPPPPVCLELFWRFETSTTKEGSRLRILSRNQAVAPTLAINKQVLGMSRDAAGECMFMVDLQRGTNALTLTAADGIHRLSIAVSRGAVDPA